MDFASPIIVRVGIKRHPFIINKDVLTRSSDYFKTALKDCWTPPDDKTEFRTLTLEDAEMTVFNVYANWLHSRIVYIRAENVKIQDSYSLLFKCYMLGDLLLDIDFKDALADAFICQVNTTKESIRYFPHNAAKKLLYASTRPSAKTRQLCVDLFADTKSANLLEDNDPGEFLRSVADGYLRGTTIDHKAMFAECKYHEHGEDEDACYRKRLFSAPPRPADAPK